MTVHDRAAPDSAAKKPDGPAPLAWTVLILLLLSYTVSFVDRTALGILQEHIKYDLQLTDWHLGLMSGPAFALLYAAAGIPLARLAEHWDRRIILSACLTVWSTMTMLCGATNSFFQMFLARMGVGIGEAGGNPVAHSLIADLFPATSRGRAIAIYSLGAPAGAFLGAALVGWLAQGWGWRHTFFLLGPPGFALALLVWFLIPNVTRGRFETEVQAERPPSLATVLRRLFAQSAYRHATAGAALVVLVGYGAASFLPAYLIRHHGLPIAEVGIFAGLVNGIAAAFGTMAGGYAGDRLVARNPRLAGVVPACSVLIATPLMIFGFMSKDLAISMLGIFLGTMFIYGYIAPTFSLVHTLSSARSRATATALFYLVINMVGTGLGPPLIGAISDAVSVRAFAGSPARFHALCTPGAVTATDDLCRQAAAAGLTSALAMVSLLLVWASIHFWLIGRSRTG